MNWFNKNSSNDDTPKRLQVKVGPSIKNLVVCNVNDETTPHFIENNLFVGYIVVRVKNFTGVTRPLSSPDADGDIVYQEPISSIPYFNDVRKRTFSIQVTGRFKQEFTADDVLFGAEFENKVNPPTGAWLAMKFANLIDPALQTDMFGDFPWLYSPLLCSMNTVNIKQAEEKLPPSPPVSTSSANVITESISCPSSDKDEYAAAILGKWEWTDRELPEDSAFLTMALQQESNFDKRDHFASDDIAGRRKYFQKKEHRTSKVFKEGQLYSFEIFAPFIDLNTFDLSLGINVNVHKYLNNQPIRLMSKSQSMNEQFFVVEFDLVRDTVDSKDSKSGKKSSFKKKFKNLRT